MSENPDILAYRAFLADPRPVALTSGPLLTELGAWLMETDPDEGSVTLRFDPPALFRQGAGAIQGGVVTTMLDFGMAFAAFSQLSGSQTAATTTINTHIMAGARPGEVTVIGQVDRMGRTLCHTSARMEQAGRLIATASSSLVVLGGG